MSFQGILLASSAVVALAWASSAQAQAAADTTVVQEVIVTAERRETTVQKTPIAISAYTTEQIEARGLNTVAALTNAAPSVKFYDAIGQGFVSIRGVGAERNTTVGGDPSVAFNVDGVYIARNNGPASIFYDVDRIEVLRGPQGTLYGRNATGGVINVINAAPRLDQFGADGDLTFGAYNRVRARGAVNLPIAEGKAALRLSGLFETRDGYTENVRPGGGADVNDQDDRAARLQLLLQPTDDLTSITRVSYTDRRGHGPQDKFMGAFSPLITTVYRSPANPQDPYKTVTDIAQHFSDRTTGVFNSTDWKLNDSPLGDVKASMVLGYIKEKFGFYLDPDSTGAHLSDNYLAAENEQKSAELRLASNGEGALNWVVGAYWLQEDNFGSTQFNAYAPTGAFLQSQTASLGIKATSKAIFGQVNYAITDALRLTAGLRYSTDEKSGDQRIKVLPANIGLTDISRRNWDATTGKIGLDYDLSPGHLIYGQVSRGYKAGGYGLNQTPYNPEYVWAYEIGSKNRFLNGSLVLNGSIFYYDQSDKQIAFTGLGLLGQPTLIIQNVAQGEVRGAELEWQARPASNWLIDGSVSYLDATYKSYASIDPSQPAAGVVNLAGQRQVFSPEWSFNLGVQYRFDLGSAGSLTPRADLNWVDDMKLRPFGRPADIQPSAEHLDLHLAWRSSDEKLVVDAFVENATDKAVRIATLYSGLTGGFQSTYGAPRTYGVRFGYRY
jgi:iron complex outermembrane receptor protein